MQAEEKGEGAGGRDPRLRSVPGVAMPLLSPGTRGVAAAHPYLVIAETADWLVREWCVCVARVSSLGCPVGAPTRYFQITSLTLCAPPHRTYYHNPSSEQLKRVTRRCATAGPGGPVGLGRTGWIVPGLGKRLGHRHSTHSTYDTILHKVI